MVAPLRGGLMARRYDLHMENPICSNCQTDAYLHILEYQSAHTVRDDRTSLQGARSERRKEPAFCRYLCARCGTDAGHSVPDAWDQVPSVGSDALARLSAEQGFFFDRYGQKTEQTTDSQGRTLVWKQMR